MSFLKLISATIIVFQIRQVALTWDLNRLEAAVSLIDGKKTVVHRNAAVGIDGAIQPQTKDILDGLVRRFDLELA